VIPPRALSDIVMSAKSVDMQDYSLHMQAVAMQQRIIHRCFTYCISSPNRVLTSYDQNCLEGCARKQLEARSAIVNALNHK